MPYRIYIEPRSTGPEGIDFARRKRPILFALFLMALLVNACSWMSDAPEARARDFIKGLIIQTGGPQQIAGAGMAFAADPTPPKARLGRPATDENRLDDLETRVAIEYLRAKHAQGVKLAFGYAGVHSHTSKGRIVTIVVTEPKAGKNGTMSTKKIFRFQVRLREAKGGWHVASVTSKV